MFAFLLQCLKQYVELLIKEGLETAISCPDSACPKRGHLQENEVDVKDGTRRFDRWTCTLPSCSESDVVVSRALSLPPPRQIECMVATEMMQRYKKLQFERGESSPLFIGGLTATHFTLDLQRAGGGR